MNASHAKLKDLPKEIRLLAEKEHIRQNLNNETNYLIRYFHFKGSMREEKYWNQIDREYSEKWLNQIQVAV